MKIYRTISRYYLIISKIRDGKFPSFRDIQSSLAEHDIEISRRTLQRDIDNLRYEFTIEIKYDKVKDGYYIDEENSYMYDYFFRSFEMTMISGTLSDSIKSGKETSGMIALESEVKMQGVQYIDKLLLAIRSKQEVEFTYKRYNDELPFSVTILPGLLKEYQNRWYVIGINKDYGKLRTYGLDRILSIKLSNVTFEEYKIVGIKDHFNNVLGVGFPDNPVETIELSFTPEQGQYIKSLKIHHSQKIIKDDSKETRVELQLSPNYELKQKIMSYGEKVRVIKPVKLRDEIKDSFKKFIAINR